MENKDQGPNSIKRCHLTSIGNPIVEIRRSYNHLISTMGLPIWVRQHLYIESGPSLLGIVTIMVAEVLVMQEARTSAAMVFR